MYSTKILSISRQQRYLLKLRLVGTLSDTNSGIPNPRKINSDMIGPTDPVSNLRRIIFKESKGETELERRYRELRSQVQDWNEHFWTQHNSSFFQKREEYLKKNLPPGQQNLTADEMSVFYKAFLDKNWDNHVNYNIEWYKKNINLMRLSIQVKISRIFKL